MNRRELEHRVLYALKHHLMDPGLFTEFCAEFTREVNRLRMDQSAALAGKRNELKKVEREIRKIIEAIKCGMFQPSMKEEMDQLESRKAIATDEGWTAVEWRLKRELPASRWMELLKQSGWADAVLIEIPLPVSRTESEKRPYDAFRSATDYFPRQITSLAWRSAEMRWMS